MSDPSSLHTVVADTPPTIVDLICTTSFYATTSSGLTVQSFTKVVHRQAILSAVASLIIANSSNIFHKVGGTIISTQQNISTC
ncbi:hypothetical protein EG68_03078 [Paragonimus skrjabini miyazakii]|uniref:Uncharacterized protein n=1 Tax=Paragonimus skrjabini miyazakii TaxID=59628 RepID=A0A8S9YVY3_9TREM|nr:hypothetical protein EG68_03078 [Paragonimus skrjabini miyazakii]